MRLRQRRNLHLYLNAYANCTAMMRADLCVGLRNSIVMGYFLMAMHCWVDIETVCGTRIDHSPNAASHKLEHKGQDQRPKCAIHILIIHAVTQAKAAH